MTELTGVQAENLSDRLLTRRESLTFETKRVSKSMVSRALDTVCAFANTEGGILALGVEDFDKASGRARLIGIDENPEAVDELTRKLRTQFEPPIEGISLTTLHLGASEPFMRIVLVRVPPSAKVHSIVNGGTLLRLPSSNRVMSVTEIIELSYKRGVTSAESEAVDIPLLLLETPQFTAYFAARGMTRGDTAHKLLTLGLGKTVGERVLPTRAAVLLFAEFPSDLLAAHGSRAAIRVFHYAGNAIGHGPNPNLKKPPKTIPGPVNLLINKALMCVIEEISTGFSMAASGFAAAHVYPERVLKEAITNAVLHRDYRYGRDIQIRIFDNRIEVESPGEFPANITAATIQTTRSKPRNPSLVMHVRDFPNPPNADAGEGVPMMFETMHAQGLYPPQYRVLQDAAIPCVLVTLLNEQRPANWEQVSDWIDRHGFIANRDLRQIAEVDTLEASRMLKAWVTQGVLVADENASKKLAAYRKPAAPPAQDDLLSSLPDNKPRDF